MQLLVIAYVHLVLGAPDLSIKHASADRAAVNMTVSGHDELLEQCLGSGLETRYRFEVRLCRRRSFWFDDCGDEAVVHHSVRFDPISEIYKVALDRLGDDDPPRRMSLSSRSDAIGAISAVKNLNLMKLAKDDPRYLETPRAYLNARVVSECKGEYSKTLTGISSVLTFGLVKIDGIDSGWIRYDLPHDPPGNG